MRELIEYLYHHRKTIEANIDIFDTTQYQLGDINMWIQLDYAVVIERRDLTRDIDILEWIYGLSLPVINEYPIFVIKNKYLSFKDIHDRKKENGWAELIEISKPKIREIKISNIKKWKNGKT